MAAVGVVTPALRLHAEAEMRPPAAAQRRVAVPPGGAPGAMPQCARQQMHAQACPSAPRAAVFGAARRRPVPGRSPVPVPRAAGSIVSAPEPEEPGAVSLETVTETLDIAQTKEEEEDHNHVDPLTHAIEQGLGSVILLAATACSMILANSAVGGSWQALWDTTVGPAIGGHKLTVQGWINEGLMALFFFAVGLEIKRECVFGALASIKQCVLPCAAALGGMVVPMGIYAALNMGTGGTMAGWAIPMATDIAFAMGIFGFFSRYMPRSASAFLLTLATVDDLGAIAVIALFFTAKIHAPFLAAAAAITATLYALPKLTKHVNVALYAVLGGGLWYALLRAGINADIAGVVTAFAIPATAPAPAGSRALPLEEHMKPTLMDHLVYKMLPWTALVIMPLFALANTAVAIDVSALSGLFKTPVALGIMAGLLLGKPLGISAFSLLSIKAGLASMPVGMGLKHLLVLGLLGGVGFTMCLFLIALSLAGTPDAMRLAKLAVIAASAIAGIGGAIIMKSFSGDVVEDPAVPDEHTAPSALGAPELYQPDLFRPSHVRSVDP